MPGKVVSRKRMWLSGATKRQASALHMEGFMFLGTKLSQGVTVGSNKKLVVRLLACWLVLSAYSCFYDPNFTDALPHWLANIIDAPAAALWVVGWLISTTVVGQVLAAVLGIAVIIRFVLMWGRP